MNPISSGFSSNINDWIADSMRAAIKDFVFFEDSKSEGIDQWVLGIAIGKDDFTADGWDPKTVSVECNSADHALDDVPVLRTAQRSESKAVHCGYRPRSHRENIAQDAADARGRPLERFDVGRVVVRLDLERDGQTVADIDDAGIFSRSLQNSRAFGRQPSQVYTRAFVAAVLAPHHAENAELREVWRAFEDSYNLLIFGLC